MTYCRLVVWLAWTAVILALLPYLLEWLARSPIGERFRRYCEQLCRIWVGAAFLLGLALGGLLFCCGREFAVWLGDDPCRQAVLLALLLLLCALYCLAMTLARCGFEALPRLSWPIRPHATTYASRGGISVWWLILLLALLILYLLRRCCSGVLEAGTEWDLCARLLLAVLLLLVLLVALRSLAVCLCGKHDPKGEDCARRLRLWVGLVILTELLAVVLIYRCCERLRDRDFDLAIIGIWWQGDHGDDERGAHLRWSFRYDPELKRLPFPEHGFDLQRRPSGTSSWTTLNPERIFPATTWGDEAGAPAGEMWRPEAVERLHPDDWDRFRGQPFEEFVETLGRPAYEPLYYVEEPAAGALALPSGPFTDELARDAWLESYYDQGSDEEPMPILATWELEPLGTILTAAMHPEIARLAGLYYVDKTAAPDTEFDYRVVGYWTDRTRRWTVRSISAANTAPLQAPVLDVVDSPLPMGEAGGVQLADDRSVGLSWTPPLNAQAPQVDSNILDVIRPVVFGVEHQAVFVVPDEGVDDLASLGTCALPVPEEAFAPARLPNGAEAAPVLVAPLEDDGGQLFWPEYFFYHRGLPYGCHAYRVVGRDVFGRLAPPTGSRVRMVSDATGPPAPAMVRVNVYQRSDPSLAPELRSAHFADDSDHEFSIQVSWLWSPEQASRSPDLREFHLHAVLPDFEPFPDALPPPGPPPWTDGANWSFGPIGPPVLRSEATALPQEYLDLDLGDPSPLQGAEYFQVLFTEQDLESQGISMGALGLEVRGLPGDQKPVHYAWFGVSSVDRPPFSNRGAVSAPVLAVTRDLYPPDPPDAPALRAGPFEADPQGNRSLELSLGADPLYQYAFSRMDASQVEPESGIPPDQLPECFDFEPIVRPPGTTDEEWARMQTRRAIHETVAKDLTSVAPSFLRVSPLPIDAEAATARFTDSVDATVTSEHLYATVAIDEAGNASALSCPSPVIVVKDGVPPRAPVFRAIEGGDESIALTWTVNPEPDLFAYNLYRTRDESRLPSRRKLRRIASLAGDGADLADLPPDTADGSLAGTGAYATITFQDAPVQAGVTYYYRLEAEDTAGNRSLLSKVASGSAYDTTPPGKLDWAEPAFELAPDGSSLTLRWQELPEDPGLRIQLQQRAAGTPLWRMLGGGWLDAGTLEFIDTSVAPGGSYEYRVRGMDAAGNRASSEDWSDTLAVDVPGQP